MRTNRVTRSFLRQPYAKRLVLFIKRYSAQLSFAILVIIFLTVTVGEGQAYNVESPKIPLQVASQNSGFFGKPQIFAGQTVSTGEVQTYVAIIYQVEGGDSLVSIAKRYNLSPGTILDANHIPAAQADKIKIGTQLVIPAEDTNTSADWLAALNKAKEEQQQLALAAQKKQQTSQGRAATSSRTSSPIILSGDVTYVGTLWLPYNGGYSGQCTSYVHYRRPDLPNGMGNGGQYLASARAKGLPTGSIPRVGAVVVTSESWYGHVAIVDSVSGDTLVISEMNYLGPGKIDHRVISASASQIKGYIY